MPKYSSFDRFIAPQFSEEEKKVLLEEAGKFKMALGGTKHELDREKSPVETETFLLMDELTNKLRQKYGLEDFTIPIQNFHVMDSPPMVREQEIGGYFGAESQFIIARSSISKTEFADRVCHELIHFKSHSAIQVPTEGDEIDFKYRSGFSANSRDGKKTYFSMLDEALTEELSIRIVEELKRTSHPLLAGETEETKKIQAEYGVELQGQLQSKEIMSAKYIEDEGVKKIKRFFYSYEEQRDVLHMLVDKLYAQNAGQFTNKEQILDLFFKSKLQGNFLGIAKLIDKTFGQGTFRKIGELSGSEKTMNDYVAFVKSL